jgi:hypothetical protein
MRALLAAAALCLITAPALAASPKVEAAVKVFKAVAADPGKTKMFCDLATLMDKLGDKEDKALETQIDAQIEKIGADFKTAWETGESLDEKSADGKAYAAALDDLGGKCQK